MVRGLSTMWRLAAMVLGLVVALGWLGGVSADSVLVSSSPETNAVLPESPTAIELVFAGPVKDAEISLLANDGTVSGPGVGTVAADQMTVTVEIPTALKDGTWTVLWTATYTQTGIPVAGSFGFRIGALPSSPSDTGAAAPLWATLVQVGAMGALLAAAVALLGSFAGRPGLRAWGIGLALLALVLIAMKAVLSATTAPAAAGLTLRDGLGGLNRGDHWLAGAALLAAALAAAAGIGRLPSVGKRVLVGLAVPAAIAGVLAGPLLGGMLSIGGTTEPPVNPTLVRVDLASNFPLADGTLGVVDLGVSPSLPGENSVVVQVSSDGNPLASGQMPMVDILFTPIAHPGTPVSVNPVAMPIGGLFTGAVTLDNPGWWHAAITLVPPTGDPVRVNQWYLLPDPNVVGDGPISAADPVARAVWARALSQWRGLTSIAYSQRLGEGSGVLYQSSTQVSAPVNGRPAQYRDVSTNAETIIIGDTQWTRIAGGEWQESAAASLYLPSEWGEVYANAVGFQLGPVEIIDGREYQVIAFNLPKAKRNAAAWYLWWVERVTGEVHREVMVSTRHYMLYHFTDYGVPVELTPPAERKGPPASP